VPVKGDIAAARRCDSARRDTRVALMLEASSPSLRYCSGAKRSTALA
jgi:hypothetical protein